MTIENILLCASILIMIAASFTNGSYYIRGSIVVFSLVMLLQNYMSDGPSWAGMTLLLFLGITNIAWMTKNRKKEIPLFRNEKEKLLYEVGFPGISIKHLRKIIYQGEFIDLNIGDIIMEHGKPVLHLYMLLKGKARVVQNGNTIATLHPGDLIGEMSFISKHPAIAMVCIIEPGVCIRWPQEPLRKMLKLNPEIQKIIQSAFVADFEKKHGVEEKIESKSHV
jgi:hypothetical protein